MDEEVFDDIEILEDLEEISEAVDLETAPSFDISCMESPIMSRYRYAMSRSSLPFIILDTSLRIMWLNEALFHIFGVGENIIGLHISEPFDQVTDPGSGESLSSAAKSMDTGLSYRGRIQVSNPRRLTRQANILISPIFQDEGDHFIHSGYSAFFDDVTEENKSILRNTFLSLLHASQMKDNDTGKHIKRVGEYSRLIAKQLYDDNAYPDVDAEFIDNITFLAPMHDVGKIGTPDDILNKEGPLDPWEWDVMREHTINGAYIMSTYPHAMAKQIALSHHERWDGSGYPYHLSEDMIPLSARIVALADVYDALRMKRSYKQPFTHEKAVAIILESSGSHFDPDLIRCFTDISETICDVYELLKDEVKED